MEIMRWIFGMGLMAGGAGVLIHAAWVLRRDHSALIRAWVDGFKSQPETPVQHTFNLAPEPPPAKQPEPEPVVEEQPKPERDPFEATSFQETVRYENIPLRQTGRDQHYDLEQWGKMLAWLIYNRLVPDLEGRVGSLLKPGMFKHRVDDRDKLASFAWTRVFADETTLQHILHYYNIDVPGLATRLRTHLLETLESFLSQEAHDWLSEILVLDVFQRDLRRATCFHADFLPLLPEGSTTIPCEAYILLASGLGRVAMPAPDGAKLQFSDQTFMLKQGYFPLLPGNNRIIEIGPHDSCHIQTNRQNCAGTLTLGWRETREIGVGGILEVRNLVPGTGESYQLRYSEEGESRLANLKSGTKTHLHTGEEGERTTCEIWAARGEGEHLLLTLVMLNRKPPLDVLPDCNIYEEGMAGIQSEEDLARMIASQIYVATKQQKNENGILNLDSDAGRAFFESPAGGPIYSKGRKREPLRCRIKLCLSTTWLARLHEWMGDREMPGRLAAAVLELVENHPVYNEAMSPCLPDLRPREGMPGLSISVAADNALGPETLLSRCLPEFVPNRRREIFGRLELFNWPEARDHSDFSCREGVTFFTDYPKGKVALYLSRFPVYDIQVPQLFGAVKLHILEPGTRAAVLKVENNASSSIEVDGKPLHRPSSLPIELGNGPTREVTLRIGEREASVLLYETPRAQLDEPDFVPEPAQLQLQGLTLHRRLERTGWETDTAFRELWRAASLHENKSLLGVSRVAERSFLAVVERGLEVEHHLFSSDGAHIRGEITEVVAAGSNTLSQNPVPGACKITAGGKTEMDYRRLDPRQRQVRHATLLLADYWDRYIDRLEPLLPEDHRLARVELARCKPNGTEDQHLYLVETRDSEERRHGFLFQPTPGLNQVFVRTPENPLACNLDTELIPLPNVAGNLFLLNWHGERHVAISFDLEDHEEQVSKYLSDGFLSFLEDAPYSPGGMLGKGHAAYKSHEPLYISAQPLHLHYEEQDESSRRCLNFNPRQYANFFDKDSYRVYYSGDAQAFVIEAVAHRKEAITPKTVFMVVPEGGHAILGSHALGPIKIPNGVNHIVLPGLTFKLSQGPVYYA